MIDFTLILHALKNAQKRHAMTYNYTIPQVWDTFGYEKGIRLRNHEMMVDPYDFYLFALTEMMQHKERNRPIAKTKEKQGSWLKQEVLYELDLRTLTSWDHDRSDTLDHRNLYGLSDSGTFLKATILLPLLKRSGVTTLLLHQLYELDDKRSQHDYADPRAILHPCRIASNLQDPLLEDVDLMTQFHMFMDMAHRYGMRVIASVNFGRLGRNNDLLSAHPEWFYWIDKAQEQNYSAPQIAGLPHNCIPSKNACKLLYQNENTKQHLSKFVTDPKTQTKTDDFAWQKENKGQNLHTIEERFHCTSAPMFSDQINSDQKTETETTYLRFYRDQPLKQAPYLLQDTMRPDLFPGKEPLESVWDFVVDCAHTLIHDYHFDGLFLNEIWLLPQKLIKNIIRKVRAKQPHAAIIIAANDQQAYPKWKRLGVDLITSDSGYKIHDVNQGAYHNFAYGRIMANTLVCAASEFKDTPRITQYDGGDTLAKLLLFMNLFLPNSVPYLTSGQLSLEKQPQWLSPFADKRYQNALSAHDIRCHKQALLDKSFYSYTRNDYHVLINQMERFTTIRNEYLSAIHDQNSCIPVWFDQPSDSGIGFTYTLKKRALLVVCNSDVHHAKQLTIHTENMLWELPFEWNTIRQIYSGHDPYIHDIALNAFQNIPLHFEAGEVKLLEITPE